MPTPSPADGPTTAATFDPDFELEDLSHSALVVTLQEIAVQSHLLFRAFLLAVSQHYAEAEAATINPQVFTGLAGLTAQRLRDAMAIDGDDAAAIAKILQVHPVFYPAHLRRSLGRGARRRPRAVRDRLVPGARRG